MKVIFENVPEEIITLANECNEDFEGEQHYQHVNKNQRVTVNGSSLIIEGERCALWGDSFSILLDELTQSGQQPTTYETSDSRLKWSEDLSQYLSTRATPAEVLDEMRKRPQGTAWYCAADILATYAKERMPGTAEYRKAAAEGSLPPVEAYEILKLMTERGYDI